MVNIVHVSDLPDPLDPQGRSYREINRAKAHNIPLGTLVELESGVRLFVVHHARDCDGTPLYCLCFDKHDTEQDVPGRYNYKWDNGYSEEYLKVIN